MQCLRDPGRAPHYDSKIVSLLDRKIRREIRGHRIILEQLYQANERVRELLRVEKLAHEPL